MTKFYSLTDGEVCALDDSCAAPTGSSEITQTQYCDVVMTPVLTLAQARAQQTAAISAACRAAIYAGCVSSALGAPYTYPTDDKNQMNMTASALASMLPNLPAGWTTPFLCADSSGVWAMRPHTAAQIQHAASDIRALIVANVEKNATLAAQIAATQTVAAIQAITW